MTTSDVQGWLDGLKLSSQSYANNRRVVHLLFEHVPPNACDDNVRSFPTFTEDLHALRD